jgi:hypothetical protein
MVTGAMPTSRQLREHGLAVIGRTSAILPDPVHQVVHLARQDHVADADRDQLRAERSVANRRRNLTAAVYGAV